MLAAGAMSLKLANVHPGTHVTGPLAEFLVSPVLMRCFGIEKITATDRNPKEEEVCFHV